MNKLFSILGISLLVAILAVGGLVGYDIYRSHERHESPAVVVLPNGEQVSVSEETITPKETAYQGQGVTYHRKVEHARIGSLWGVSPGESLSRQSAAVINTGAAPSININPDGVSVSAGDAVQFKGGSGRFGFIDGVIQWFKDWGLTIGIVVVVGGLILVVLPLVFPASAPIVAAIWNALKTFVAWMIPFFGGLWTWIKTNIFHTATTQIVQGTEDFKTLVKNEATFTDDVKARILVLLAQSHNAAQDTAVQNVVKTIKMQLK